MEIALRSFDLEEEVIEIIYDNNRKTFKEQLVNGSLLHVIKEKYNLDYENIDDRENMSKIEKWLEEHLKDRLEIWTDGYVFELEKYTLDGKEYVYMYAAK